MTLLTALEKIVLVTRPTRLDDLVARFNTKSQARFYIEHAGGDWTDYQSEHDIYQRGLESLHATVEHTGLRTQTLDRGLLSTFLFSDHDVIVTLGGNGLVVNTAKYAGAQPIVPVNPDASRFDGVLVPFQVQDAAGALAQVLTERARVRRVTLAEATTDDGQRLLAMNDFYIGARSHVSARYKLSFRASTESQSSSGVLVSTGAGSNGWLSSVFDIAAGLAHEFGGQASQPVPLEWDDARLCFVVREPFINKRAHASMVAGIIRQEEELIIESLMPGVGTVFSDGIEDDFIAFNSGMRVHLRAARQQACLVWK